MVTTASARDPHDRFASAATCGRALRDLLVPSRVSPTLVIIASALVVGLGTLAGSLLWRAPAAGHGNGRTQGSAAATRLTLRPLWDRRPVGLGPYGRPTIDGRLLPLGDEQGRLVIADIDLGNQRPPIALGAADGDLPACTVTTMVSLSPSGDQAAFSCEVSEGIHELRVIGTDPARPFQRRIVTGAWDPLEWSHPTLLLAASQTSPPRLAVVDITSRTVQPVVTLAGSVDAASLSPDGRWVAFDGFSVTTSHRHDVFVVSARGGTPVPVATGAARRSSPRLDAGWPRRALHQRPDRIARPVDAADRGGTPVGPAAGAFAGPGPRHGYLGGYAHRRPDLLPSDRSDANDDGGPGRRGSPGRRTGADSHAPDGRHDDGELVTGLPPARLPDDDDRFTRDRAWRARPCRRYRTHRQRAVQMVRQSPVGARRPARDHRRE